MELAACGSHALLAFVRQKRPFVCHALRVFANKSIKLEDWGETFKREEFDEYRVTACTCNLGTSAVCHPDLLVLVFNLVVDLGYVVESRSILVIWFTLAMLAFAHVHLQVPLAGAVDRATSNCLRASLLPLVILFGSPFAQAILPHKRRTLSMVDPYCSTSLLLACSYSSPSSMSLPW